MKAFAKSWFPRAGMLFLGLGFALTTGSSSWAGEVFHETFDDVAVVAYAPNAAGNVGSGVAGDQTDELGWTYTMSASGVVEIKDLGSPFFRHPERTVKVGNIIFEVPLAAGINIDDVVSVTMKAAFAFPTNSGTSTNQGLNLYLYNTVLGQSATQPGYMLSMSADTDASPIRVYTLAGSSGATGVGTIGDFGANIYVLTVKYTRNVSTTVEWSVTSPNGGVLSESGSLILSGRIPDTTVLDRLRIVWTASATGWVDDIIIEVETPGPEAEIKDGGTTIADGGGPVDFGSAAVGAAALSKTFTVNNLGSSDLTTSNLSVPAGYSITGALSATISAGGSATFTVELPTTTAGVFSGDISFANNDSDENPYSFSVTGTITAVGPEVEVKDGATNIADGGGPVDFGTALLGGAALSKTFTVNNVGTTDLTTSPTIVPAGYTLTEPLSATIPAGGSDTFTVELPTTAGGTFTGDISFDNNDSDENPFNFSITGTIQTVSRAKEWTKFD